jgi:hypothetical protein
MSNAAATNATKTAARPVRISTHCDAYDAWSATVWVGAVDHARGRGMSEAEAVASAVAIFRMA